MKLKKVKFKTIDFKRYVSPFFLALFIYVIIAATVFANLSKISAFGTKKTSKGIVEGLFVPQSNINTGEIFNVDPLLTSSQSESVQEIRKNISFLIFSSLFRENIAGTLDKDIVADYIFKDAKSLSVKLVDNVYWQDGVKLTANDVVYTLNLIKAIGQNGIYYGAINGDEIEYNVVNDLELTISLTGRDGARPNVAYLQELTFPILPKHMLEIYSQAQINSLPKTEFGQNPVGSGKLIYKSNIGSELELIRNNNYYQKPVSFDSYKFRFYKSYEDLSRDFALKNVDFFTRKDAVSEDDINYKLISAGAKSFKTVLKDRRFVMYFNLGYKDQANSPFIKSISLRSGLLKVINRANILASVNNYGREVYGPIDQTSWAFLPDVQSEQVLNIADFTKKIETQGYVKNGDFYEKNGIKLGFTLTLLNGETRNNIATQIQKDLKSAGVNVNLKVIGSEKSEQDSVLKRQLSDGRSEITQINDVVNNRDFEVLLTAVNHFQDPDVFSEWHSSKIAAPGLNLADFSSKVGDITLVEGRIEQDQEKRKSNYIRFQHIFMQEVPAVYLMNPANMSYYSPRISNIVADIINDTQYKYQNISDWVVKVQ